MATSRAFDPGQPRGPHTGQWIAAGKGLAGHLHGKPVTGRPEQPGPNVHGVYTGGGYVKPRFGRQVKVTHVRPRTPVLEWGSPHQHQRQPGPLGALGAWYGAVPSAGQMPAKRTGPPADMLALRLRRNS